MSTVHNNRPSDQISKYQQSTEKTASSSGLKKAGRVFADKLQSILNNWLWNFQDFIDNFKASRRGEERLLAVDEETGEAFFIYKKNSVPQSMRNI